MQGDPQLSMVLTKAKKANIMSSLKVNTSLPESQGQGLWGQGQGLDFRDQGQGHANLASRRLEAKAVASRTTSLVDRQSPIPLDLSCNMTSNN
jgi:hypothetical protein